MAHGGTDVDSSGEGCGCGSPSGIGGAGVPGVWGSAAAVPTVTPAITSAVAAASTNRFRRRSMTTSRAAGDCAESSLYPFCRGNTHNERPAPGSRPVNAAGRPTRYRRPPARNSTTSPPPWPAGRPAAPTTRSPPKIEKITHDPRARHVLDRNLTGDAPADHRLAWNINPTNRQALETRVFGKRTLITDHDHWPVADVVAGYRSQSEIEFGFRQLKDPHDVSFSPMYHWTDHNIAVHTFTCVLALQLAHLLRLRPTAPGTTYPSKPSWPPGRHPGNRTDLPLHRRTTQGPPHHHRHDHRPTSPPRPVRPQPMDTDPDLGHTPDPTPHHP